MSAIRLVAQGGGDPDEEDTMGREDEIKRQEHEGEYTDVEEPDGERRPERVIEEPGQYTDVDRDEEV